MYILPFCSVAYSSNVFVTLASLFYSRRFEFSAPRQLEKRTEQLQEKHEIQQKNTDAHPKTLQHGPLGRSWGNLFVESVLDRTSGSFLICFWWLLECLGDHVRFFGDQKHDKESV